MEILALQNVEYSYDKKKKVLKGINAQMETGKMYAILGPSGCGKTTLLSLLGGLDSPTNGQILFNGTDIEQSGLGHHRKKHVSFIFQSYNLIDYMTPQENVRLTAKKPALPFLERLGLLCNTGWERKMPGFDCVIAMVDANVHGFTHPFLLVVENLRSLLS